MNEIAIKPESTTLLQKVRELSRPQQTSSLLSRNNDQRTRDIVNAHPIQYYVDVYSTTCARELAREDVELGALVILPYTENPTLCDCRNAYGERATISWMLPHISGINAVSSASNRMDSTDIVLCCRNLLSAYPWFTLAEFCVFCQRMIQLRYVQHRSDYVFGIDTVIRGLREFLRDRVDEIARYEREHRPQPDYSNAVTYQEYCRMVGKKPTSSPIQQLAEKTDYRQHQQKL